MDGISCAPGLECLRGAQKNESCCGFGVPLVSGEPTLPPSSPMHSVFVPLSLGYLLNVLDVSYMQKGLWAVSTWADKIVSALPVVWTDEVERSDDRTLGWGELQSGKLVRAPTNIGAVLWEMGMKWGMLTEEGKGAFRGERINMGNHCTAAPAPYSIWSLGS